MSATERFMSRAACRALSESAMFETGAPKTARNPSRDIYQRCHGA